MEFIIDWIIAMIAVAAMAAVLALVYLFITSFGDWAWLVLVIILGGFALAISVQ